MSTASKSESPVQGRVKWRRFALVLAPAAAVSATLIGLTANGAIAASISVSGQQFLVTSSQLSGTGFEQFGGAVNTPQGPQPVVISAIHHATLANLCQQVSVAGLTLKLTAGGGSTPASADNLIVDASGQTGDQAVFHNITIGQDAGTLNEDPGVTGQTGGFGQQADDVTIDNLVQHTWLTTAGTFTLPGLSLGFGGTCPSLWHRANPLSPPSSIPPGPRAATARGPRPGAGVASPGGRASGPTGAPLPARLSRLSGALAGGAADPSGAACC